MTRVPGSWRVSLATVLVVSGLGATAGTAACGGPVPAAQATPGGTQEAKDNPPAPPSGDSKPAAPAPEASQTSPAPSSPTDGAAQPSDPGAKRQVPKRIGARHVLIQWMGTERAPSSVVRSREQALVLAQEVLKRARGGEDFARLAVEYSDEPNAGGRGGSLGRFGKGQMVGAFEEAAFKLDVGQISDIVETQFGFHVIQRTE